VYERCARWLLLSEERLQLTEIPLTQGYLAMMHAPNRSGLTLAAATLRKAEFIRYSHGRVTIPASLAASAGILFNFWTSESNQANVPQIIRQSFVDLKMVSQFALWLRKAFDDQERVGRVTAIGRRALENGADGTPRSPRGSPRRLA